MKLNQSIPHLLRYSTVVNVFYDIFMVWQRSDIPRFLYTILNNDYFIGSNILFMEGSILRERDYLAHIK